MRPGTEHLIRNLSNLLARGGGTLVGLSIVFLAISDPINWNWLRGVGLGTGAAILGVVLIRYIPYGHMQGDQPTPPQTAVRMADEEELEGPNWRLLAGPIAAFLIFLGVGAFAIYLASR